MSDATFTWIPEPDQLGSTYHIACTVEDGRGGTARETIMVTVTERRFLYWTDYGEGRGEGKIQRFGLGGSQVETIVSGLDYPQGIVLDVGAGKVYWTEINRIARSSLDGSQVETITLQHPSLRRESGGADLALGVGQGKMYVVTNTVPGSIYCVALSGGSSELLFSDWETEASAIGLDLSRGKIYFGDWSGGGIHRANLDGSPSGNHRLQKGRGSIRLRLRRERGQGLLGVEG